MRNKTLIGLLIFILLLGVEFVSSPLPIRAQASPTLIYQTEFEVDPTTACGGSDCYGDDSFYDEEWDSTCGVDGSACIYQADTYGNGNPVDTRWSRYMSYYEETPDTELDTTWSACVVNYFEFDIFYVSDETVPHGGVFADESRMSVAMDDDNSSSIASPTSPNDYSYRFDIDLADLPGSVQGEWFHVALFVDNDQPMDAYTIEWETSQQEHAGVSSSGTDFDLQLKIDNLQVWCDYPETFNWVRPLALEDEHPQWEMFDSSYVEGLADGITYTQPNQYVNSFSQGFHVPVHSAVAGTVTVVEPLTSASPECLKSFAGEEPHDIGMCIIFVPNEITNDGPQLYQLDLIEAYRVVVSLGDFDLTYFLYNAPDFVTVSEEIGEGCVLGETIQLKQITNVGNLNGGVDIGTGGISGGATGAFVSQLTNNGYVGQLLEVAGGDPIRLYPSLVRYATNDNPCGVTDPRFANCLETDPTLQNPESWTVQGSVIFDNPGYTLMSSNALIKEIMTLEPDVEYGLSVDIQVIDADPRVELKLGTTVEEHLISDAPGSIVTLSIASAVHLADLTDYWTVRVRNKSGAAFKVLSICVSAGEIAGQPTACYFSNPMFDNGYTNWDVSEGVGQRDGSITVPSGDTFAQDATLPADAPDTQFQLYVDVYIWTEPGVTIGRTDYTSTVALEYKFPDDSGDWIPLTGPSSTETTTFSEFALAAERRGVTIGTVSFQGFIEIDEDTTGTILIRPTVDTEETGILGVGIDRACLRGDFGIDQGDDVIGIECQEVTRPQDQLLSSWTVWLWRHFDRFFQCDLMIVLRQIRNTTTEIYRLSGWSIRYWKAAYFYNVQWLSSDLFPWLNGQFSNMAKGSQSTFYINNESGSNLWDFLVALLNNTLGPLINGLASIINTLIIQLAGLLGGLLNFAGIVLSLIAQLIFLLIQSIANLLTLIVSGLINIIMFILYAAFSLLQLIISGLFSLIFTLMVLIFTLLRDVISLFAAIITGWQNATPTPIPGLPSCETDPTNNYLCVPFYILENTIFDPSGVGNILITLIVGYGSLELIMWVIDQFRNAVLEATQAT